MYNKLFSAKCAVHVAQWNQCPIWGALDTKLHSRVFLGCQNMSCAVCHSLAYYSISYTQVNPVIPPCPDMTQVKSTNYICPTLCTHLCRFGHQGKKLFPSLTAGRSLTISTLANALDSVVNFFILQLLWPSMPGFERCQYKVKKLLIDSSVHRIIPPLRH